jgi:rod shape-determining protein MreD
VRVLAMAVIFFISLSLQSTLFSDLSYRGVKPDLLAIIVIFYSLFHGTLSGAGLGFIYGLGEDLILGRFVGLNALAKGITGYVIGLGEKRVFKENFLVPLLVCFSGTVLCQVVYLLLLSLVSGENVWLRFKGVILPQALYNSLLGLLIYGKFAKSATRGILKRSRHY